MTSDSPLSDQVRTVIIVNDQAAATGGQAKVAIESARLLAASGRDVVYFASAGSPDEALDADGITTICLDQPMILDDPDPKRAALRGLWNREAARRLHEICSASDPAHTVVHCHGFAKALSPSIGPVITGGPLAHVYTMHEYFLACPNGGFYDYQRHEICTRRPLGPSCLARNCDSRSSLHKAWRVARQATLWSFGRMPRALRDVIYISELQKAKMQPYLDPKTRLHFVPNPVATDLAPVDAGRNELFLFAGRLSPEKGGLLFAEATRLAGVRAVAVGDGPERDAMLRANPDLTVTGWLSANEVQDWMAQARCVVFPSLWYECAPLTVREALQRRLPVICGAWSAGAESIEHDVTGQIVQEPAPAAFAAAITRLTDPAHPVFTRSAERPVDVVSGPEHLKRLLSVYGDILGHAQP